MALTYRGSGTVSQSSGGQYPKPAPPAGTQAGDLLFILLTARVVTNWSVSEIPVGWTLVASVSRYYDDHYYLYAKTATADEPATYDFTLSSQYVSYLAVCHGFYDTNPVKPDLVSSTAYITADTILRAAALNLPDANTPVVFFGAVYQSSAITFTEPTGFTEVYDYGHTTPDWWQTVAHKTFASAGDTGVMDGTLSAADAQKHAFAVSLVPGSLLPDPTILTTSAGLMVEAGSPELIDVTSAGLMVEYETLPEDSIVVTTLGLMVEEWVPYPAVEIPALPWTPAKYIWILDRVTSDVHCVLSNDNPGACRYWSDLHTEREDGLETLEFTITADHEDAQFVIPEAEVILPDLDRLLRLFRIKEVTDHADATNGRYKEVYCEPAHIELKDAIITPQTFSAVTPAEYLALLLAETRWELGTCEAVDSTDWVVDKHTSVWALVTVAAAAWGCQVIPRVRVTGNMITGRYIDVVQPRHNLAGFFEYRQDTEQITRQALTNELKTALYGIGKDGLLFTEVVWTTPTNPADKPADQNWVGDPAARQIYGYESGGSLKHRYGVYENSEEANATRLLEQTWAALQQINSPRYSYDVSVIALERYPAQRPGEPAFLHERTRLGDTVMVRDIASRPPIVAEERVVEVQRSYTDPKADKFTLGHIKEQFIEMLSDGLRKLEG